jgi:hypothetical protein
VGGIIKEIIDDMILNGQSKYASRVKDFKVFFANQVRDHHVNQWINSKNHLRFETARGDQLELNKQQAMTLYAWWTREKRNTMQNAAHLTLGGFTYDLNDRETKKYKGVDLHKAHLLTGVDIAQIETYLGEEGRAFADAVVDYLSHTVSEWGNETSMALFGWKKYGEGYYFPYHTDPQFRGKNLAFGSQEQKRRLKNISASHSLTEHAHNPLKLGSFTDIARGHVNEMAMYNAFAERLDTLETLSFTAQVRAEYEHKTARFTLAYEQDGEGGRVTVMAPELIRGVSASVKPGSATLEYDSVVLDTGSLDSFGLSPLSSIPTFATPCG